MFVIISCNQKNNNSSSEKSNENKDIDSTFKATSTIVTIRSLEWMTKNLNISNFRNGDSIPQAKTNEEWLSAGRKNNLHGVIMTTIHQMVLSMANYTIG